MKKHDKEVLQSRLDAEEKELKRLKAIYNKAADDIMKKIEISNGKISVLLANWDDLTDEEKSIYQSQIYQRNFQRSLKTQIDGFLKDLNSKQYATMTEYMEDCYKNGYLGAMYSIHKQGIPIISPIDQKKVTKAMFTDSKISKKLYTKLGEDVEVLKKRIANNLSRGIATASDYKVIARNIAADSNVGFNRAMRITRTEGNRISNESAYDASMSAKDKGADVLKQWSAALDGRTRESHARVDGEIRELDEKFSNGLKYPGDSAGGAAEVVNCRCALLQRAKWALDEDELETLKERATFYGLDKTENFNDFKKKYLKAAEAEKVASKATTKTDKTIEKTAKSGKIKERPKRGQFEEYEDPKTALKMLQKETGYSADKAKKVQKVMDDYFGDGYAAFTSGNKVKETAIIDEALSKMAIYDGDIWRGMHLINRKYDEFMQNVVIGAEIQMPSVSSWTSRDRVADRFAEIKQRNNSIIFKCINNRSAVGVQHISELGYSEAEVLAPSTARWRVVSIETKDKINEYGAVWVDDDVKQRITTITVEEVE